MDQLLVLALMAVSSNCNFNPQEQRTFDDLLVAFGIYTNESSIRYEDVDWNKLVHASCEDSYEPSSSLKYERVFSSREDSVLWILVLL